MERVLTLLKSGGLFLFFLENPSKKNYTDGIFKKRLLRKNGPFPVLWRKKFFLWRRARSRGVGVRGVLARRSGRVWMDAMDCCEARRWSARSACEAFRACVDGRSWARVDGCDGGCACLI